MPSIPPQIYRYHSVVPTPSSTLDNTLTKSSSNHDLTAAITAGKLETYYGSYLFDIRRSKEYLSAEDHAAFYQAVKDNKPISPALADAFAEALFQWCQEHGVTHYTHWFQPVINAQTAEKHDTLLEIAKDQVTPFMRFTGKQLCFGETDASSFPSGGLRSTQQARGYLIFDVSSSCFIMEHTNGKTLYIPAVYFSWDKGHALDEKIPLLRSSLALQRECMNLFSILGKEYAQHHHVHIDSGIEQEFFLIDRAYYLARPDLMSCGRTVLGSKPVKGQELEDSYFAAMSARFLDVLNDLELECWKLGIPIQTRHREVAPGQYEVAPRFADANTATDRNLLLKALLVKVARKHHVAALLHEKPFAGVNGSGQHNNFSAGSSICPSFFAPGPQPEKNNLFMLFLAATVQAVSLHSDLMRVCISGASNDHRLGANEAPPAIVSIYLGEDVEQAMEKYLKGDFKPSNFDSKIDLGVPCLPANQHRATTDRNRTSTFAFTGNKFEFRAVGSSQSPSRSNTVLNTILSHSLHLMANAIQELIKGGASSEDALRQVTVKTLEDHRRIIFGGNGYSEEWQIEAKKRGLPNAKTTPEALDMFFTPKNVELYSSMKVLDKEELEARAHILYEEYIKKMCIEARIMIKLVQQSITPTCVTYLQRINETAKDTGLQINSLITKVKTNIEAMVKGVDDLSSVLANVHAQNTLSAQSHYCAKEIVPLMASIREAADALENLVPAAEWPLPSFDSMLIMQD